MKNLSILILLSLIAMTANVAQAEVHPTDVAVDVIIVKAKPALDNFEVYSLANARDAIDSTQARIQAEIVSEVKGQLTKSSARTNVSDAS